MYQWIDRGHEGVISIVQQQISIRDINQRKSAMHSKYNIDI